MRWNQRHSQEHMFSIIESYYQSGDTQKKVCKREGINSHTLKSWIRKYRKSKGFVKGKRKSNASRFIALKVKAIPVPLAKDVSIDIVYPNGVKLRVDSTLGIDQLSGLIKLY